MTFKQLINNDGANHFNGLNKIQNYCCLLNKDCVFFNNNKEPVRCKYFEDRVLPLNFNLQFRNRQERKLSTVELMRTCKRCLQPFACNNKQKYCKDCISIRRREQSRLRMQKNRKAS